MPQFKLVISLRVRASPLRATCNICRCSEIFAIEPRAYDALWEGTANDEGGLEKTPRMRHGEN